MSDTSRRRADMPVVAKEGKPSRVEPPEVGLSGAGRRPESVLGTRDIRSVRVETSNNTVHRDEIRNNTMPA